MTKILVVEDEKPINDLITMNLKLVGHEYVKAYNGAEVLPLLEQEKIDLILLDVMLPELDGFELMKRIRGMNIPVIFITAKDSLADRITGFELGAEDYLIKPFEILELLARINVVLRRNVKEESGFVLDGAQIRLAQRQVYRDNSIVELTAQEFELLEVLIQNRNIALSREKLLELAWGFEYEGETRTVDVHIRQLRKKLGWEERIKTVYKLGYRLEVAADEILA
ncbi:response regulator transcription factor [Paenibacillus sp. NPDC058174]|uniref:response regulator transcription factor n=1 Tax=Paenibacillus sp. NPDC058174 TaxID=3346366 RepID=UPI0036DE2513